MIPQYSREESKINIISQIGSETLKSISSLVSALRVPPWIVPEKCNDRPGGKKIDAKFPSFLIHQD